MALGFGTVLGAASTDRIISAAEAIPSQVSIHLWSNRNGEGPSSFARMIGRSTGVCDIYNNHGNIAGTYGFGDVFANEYWYWTRPSLGVWAPIGISVDTSSSANDPIVYQSGSKLTVGAGLTQVGADAAYEVASTAWCVGNRPSDNSRNWDGFLAEIGIWNAILTDDEFYALQKGVSPDQIRLESRLHYLPMVRHGALDKVGAPWTVTGTAAQPHPRIILPHRRSIGEFSGSGGTSHNLTAAASTQANTGGAAAITQVRALVGAATTQANAGSIGAIILGAISNLIGAASTQSNTGGTAAITPAHGLVVSTSTQNGTSSAVAITQVHVLAGAASTQGNLGGTSAITLSSEGLVGAPSTQGNISANVAISITRTLTAAASTQANLSGTGAISDGIVVEAALTTGIAETVRIKKPGIPAGTPEWLKTMLEILTGRRGNRIEAPQFQALTFSAMPTRAECEALYRYTNTVRDSLEQLINRLDG